MLLSTTNHVNFSKFAILQATIDIFLSYSTISINEDCIIQLKASKKFANGPQVENVLSNITTFYT